MRSHREHAHNFAIGRVGPTGFLIPLVCVVLLAARVGTAEQIRPGSLWGGMSALPGASDPENGSGPTIQLSYNNESFVENPISSFMYFVPLVSTTLVDRQTSADNTQAVAMTSYKRKIAARSFSVTCEFALRGEGFHKNVFEPIGLIAAYEGELKEGEALATMLDYIQFEGAGFGRIHVKGTINGSTETVTEVNLRFNLQGRKSPVTIGLYDIKPRDGRYEYENRSNKTVARVNSLAFKKSAGIPRMGVTVASIAKAGAPDGFIARIKGTIANLLIDPPIIDEPGNQAMLDFGYALFKQETEFTFPKARNLQVDRLVPATGQDQ